jgi:hypothetical protein
VPVSAEQEFWGSPPYQPVNVRISAVTAERAIPQGKTAWAGSPIRNHQFTSEMTSAAALPRK